MRGPHAIIPIGAVATAALVEQPVGEVQVLLFAGGPEQFHQGQFDLLMPRHPMAFPGTEDRHHVVGHADAHVQQFALARDLIVGHARLDHVTGAVHLVPVHIVPALFQSGKRIEGVDVAIRLLGRGKFVNPFVALGFQQRVRMVLQGIGHALQGLVHVGIVKEDARMHPAPLRRILEIADATGLVFNLVDT